MSASRAAYDDPRLFLSRQTSWIEFNRRVLSLASDAGLPLLERVRYFAISGENLDSFFMKRVGALMREAASGLSRPYPWPLSAVEELHAVSEAVRELQAEQSTCLREALLPELAAQGVNLCDYEDLDRAQRRFVDRYFEDQLFPVLTPLAVDPGRPFPYISNLTVSLAVVLRLEDGAPLFARVKVPANRPRWIQLPDSHSFVATEQVIANHLEKLFRRMTIVSSHPFRVTRSADVARDDAAADDLFDFAVSTVRERKFAPVVRLEVDATMPDEPRELLINELGLSEGEVFEVHGPLGIASLAVLCDLDLPHLQRPVWKPLPHPRFPRPEAAPGAVFDAIRERDIVVHHPYHDYAQTVVSFLDAAARDPQVLAIKQSLYRTAALSATLEALIRAAEADKEVTALLELKARLDEAANIAWAQRLDGSGIHMAYGFVGFKIHCRMTLVVRVEEDGLRRYVHLSTGDYNDDTARFYSDVGLFTCAPELCADIGDIFNFLTGYADVPAYRKLVVAPTDMRQRFLEGLEQEIAHQQAGREGRVVAMMNALVDFPLAQAICRASQAGVRIDLIIRGECCLRPGVPGATENLRVKSVLGPFLEHARLIRFANGGEDRVYLASADWMYRNLDHRLEIAALVEEPTARDTLIELLDRYLDDNVTSWRLRSDGRWSRVVPDDGEPPFSVQAELMRRATHPQTDT